MDFGRQTEGENHFEEQDADGISKLKYILKKSFGRPLIYPPQITDKGQDFVNQAMNFFVNQAMNFPTAQIA